MEVVSDVYPKGPGTIPGPFFLVRTIKERSAVRREVVGKAAGGNR